jgi:hypothetical protein
MQGGSRPQMPQGGGSVTGTPGQTLHSQISSGMYILGLYFYLWYYVSLKF